MNKTVAKMLGEGATDELGTDAVDVAQAAPQDQEQAAQLTYSNPTVDQLQELWNGGSHEAVALRVLDALDHYADFLELAFRIGHEGALELGQIMDNLTADEQSPHEYDALSDEDAVLKAGKRPGPGDTSNAIGAEE